MYFWRDIGFYIAPKVCGEVDLIVFLKDPSFIICSFFLKAYK